MTEQIQITAALEKRWPVKDWYEPKSHYSATVENDGVHLKFHEYSEVWPTFEDDATVARFVFDEFPSVNAIHFDQGVNFSRNGFEKELAHYRSLS